MAKGHEIDPFEVAVRWSPGPEPGERDPVRATFGWLRVQLGDQALTHYRADDGREGDEVQVPLYHLAEWIAVNWWALLHEPKKTDEAEQDFDFRSRHWLGVARNGFALPDTWIIPAGGRIEISSFARRLPATRLGFTETARAALDAPVVRSGLHGFVNSVFKRLTGANITETLLGSVWTAVLETTPDEEEFCRLMGSLGLSPYDDHPEIEQVLDCLSETLDRELLRDLCEAVSPTQLGRMARTAMEVWREIPRAPEADISKLRDCPGDTTTERAAKWGIEAAYQARRYFGIRASDPQGADAFFDAIRLPAALDNIPMISPAAVGLNSDLIAGAVDRDEDAMRFTLVRDDDMYRRRFAGARAAFLAWSGRRRAARLMTDARTRDQQASRAFAAEILAPESFVRSKATNGVLSIVRVRELAQTLRVSPAVIQNQAKNVGLAVQGSSWEVT